MSEFKYGSRKLDKMKCKECGHLFAVHNLFNCTYAWEKEDECHCALGRDTLEARYWAVKMRKERDEANGLLSYYLGWINANRND